MSAIYEGNEKAQLALSFPFAPSHAARKRPESFSLDGRGFISRAIRRRGTHGTRLRMSRIGRSVEQLDGQPLDAYAEHLLLRRTARASRATRTAAIRVVDLFSGCGGMSLGVREACDALGLRFESAGAFDIEPVVVNVFNNNFETNVRPLDLRQTLQLNLEAAPSDQEFSLVDQVGRLDFVVAGPPCQGHSNLNNATRRNDPRNELYFSVARFAQLTSPRWILIENVMTVTKDKSDVVARTRHALTNMGYSVSTTVADLWTIGIAQMRRRHLLFAYLPEKSPFGENRETAEAVVSRYSVEPRTLRWAIEDLKDREPVDFMDVPARSIPITQQRIDYLFDRGLYDLPDSQRPDCHRLKSHTYQSVYGRLHWDRPAPTITGGFDTMGRGRFVHPERRRTLTPREAARIQGFPDYFDFSAAASHRRVLAETIGNAVPPKLSYIFALECLR